jgi:hypothetical protein
LKQEDVDALINQVKATNHEFEWNRHVIWASQHYMTNPFPENFRELGELELMEYIEDNVWLPFNKVPPKEVLELVEYLASSAIKHFDGEELLHE